MSLPKNLTKAHEHIACVRVLNSNDLSRQACYHLLAAISSASSALTDGKGGFRSFEEIPQDIFVRTGPIQMTNLMAALQGIVGNDEIEESLAFDYAANGLKIADDFIADVLDHLHPVEAPAPR